MMIFKHIYALWSGEFKNYELFLCLKYYFKLPRKKNLLLIIREFIILYAHWKVFPAPYFQHAMFLKESQLSLADMKKFIPARSWLKIADTSMQYKIICDDKALFYDLAVYYGFSQPKMIFKFHNNTFFDEKNNRIAESDVDAIISNQPYEKILIKDSMGDSGKNIFMFFKTKEKKYQSDNEIITAKYIQNKFRNKKIILQEGIIQSNSVSRIYPDSVNTIRIVTKNDRNNIKFIGAVIRFGRNGNFLDNGHAGGISVNIDIETGKFGSFAKAYYDNTKYCTHPNTGFRFEGQRIEQWEAIKETVIRGAYAFHQIPFIGWDIVVTDEKIIILEINKRPCMYLLQMTNGGVADKLL